MSKRKTNAVGNIRIQRPKLVTVRNEDRVRANVELRRSGAYGIHIGQGEYTRRVKHKNRINYDD